MYGGAPFGGVPFGGGPLFYTTSTVMVSWFVWEQSFVGGVC